MSKMSDMGIAEMTHGLEAGVFTSEALIREVLSQVERDQALNIWLEVKPSEILLAEARLQMREEQRAKLWGHSTVCLLGLKTISMCVGSRHNVHRSS